MTENPKHNTHSLRSPGANLRCLGDSQTFWHIATFGSRCTDAKFTILSFYLDTLPIINNK